MRVKSFSGAIRRPRTATTLPSAARTGAAANIVGTPARRLPCASGSIATLGNGGVTSASPFKQGRSRSS